MSQHLIRQLFPPRRDPRRLGDAVARVKALGSPAAPATGRPPIFILSAGWRTGSTLLQRLVVSSGDTLVWGEPLGNTALIQTMADSLKWFLPPTYHPRCVDGQADALWKAEAGLPALSEKWIANFFPSVEDLHAAHRAFFERLFAEPARRHGATGWGIKEIRWEADMARYLKWVYPDAKFLFLLREPAAAFRSFLGYEEVWYACYPTQPIWSPFHFARQWKNLALSFVEFQKSEGGRVVRYEDLIASPLAFAAIEDYLGLKMDRRMLDLKLTGSRPNRKCLNFWQSWLLEYGLAGADSRCGYRA